MIEQAKAGPSTEPAPPPVGETTGRQKVRVRRKERVRQDSVSHQRDRFYEVLPWWVWFVVLALAGLGAFSANPVLTPFSLLLLPVFASLLWIRGEPPVLLFACAMQWLQASVAVFYTDFYGLALQEMHGGAELIKAIWLSLIGVLVLAVGVRAALVRRTTGIAGQVEHETRLLDPSKVFVWYFIAFVVFSFVGRVASQIPSLAQPVLATLTLKWVLVFLLAYSVLSQRRYFALLGITVCLEFFTGLLGYFASFKSVFFVLLVVLPTAGFLFKGWRLAQFCVVAAVVLALGIVWSVIKGDYREFLNQGSGQQTVLVPVSERVAKLNELVGDLDRNRFDQGLDELIMRVSYVNYFAMTLSRVPDTIPFENGGLWLGAVKHVLMPRFLFPNKESIDDSARTEKYTGYQAAGAEQGTSISLGYMAESYIDFGARWMFVPILFLGLFYGFIYRFFVDHQRCRLLGFATATAILVFGAYTIETSNIKLVGGNLMGLIVMGLFVRFFGNTFWGLITDNSGKPVSRYRSRRRGVKPREAEARQMKFEDGRWMPPPPPA